MAKAEQFIKLVHDAATERGLEGSVGPGNDWISVETGIGYEDAVLLELTTLDLADGAGWAVDVWERNENGDFRERLHFATGTDTASLFRLLGTWLG